MGEAPVSHCWGEGLVAPVPVIEQALYANHTLNRRMILLHLKGRRT